MSPRLSAVSVSFAVFTVVTTILILWISYTPVPMNDMLDYWRWRPGFDADWTTLFSQHNEHRIALPRLFFLADQYLFRATGIFPRACSFAIWCLEAVLVCRLCPPTTRWPRIFAYGVVISLLFSALQDNNFADGFQISFPLMYLLASVAIVALIRCPVGGNGWFLLALAAATGSTYSMAGGLLVWPVLVLLSWYLRLSLRQVAALATFGVSMWLIYFHHYQAPGHHANPVESLTRLPAVLRFLMTLIGSPVDALVSIPATVFRLGNMDSARLVPDLLAGVVVTVMALTIAFRLRRRSTARQTALLGVLLFLLLTFVVTALGRVNLPMSAVSSRYMSGVLLFWTCLYILGSSLLRIHLVAVVVVFLLIVLFQPIRLMQVWNVRAAKREMEAAFLNPEVVVPEMRRKAYPPPADLAEPLRYLKANGLAMYSPQWTQWIGDRIGDHYAIQSGGCSGAVTSSEIEAGAGASGARITGWAWDRISGAPPTRVVLTDADNWIVGFGLTTTGSRWVGYVQAKDAGKEIRAFAVSRDGARPCSQEDR